MLAGIENALSDRILPNLNRLEKWHEPNKIKYNARSGIITQDINHYNVR